MRYLIQPLVGLSLLALSYAGQAADCETGAGQQAFQTKCAACHALDADRVGPRLKGVVGRSIGSIPGFKYSRDLAQANSTWTVDQLDRWLSSPAAMFPDTAMAFGGLRNASERQAVLCFLQTQS